MGGRVLLVTLLLASTVAFVVGVSLERNVEDTHTAAAEPHSGEAGEGEAAEGSEDEAAHAGEANESPARVAAESSGEEGDATVIGIDLESTPFLVLASLGSLALAAAVWARPRMMALLIGVAVAMAIFAAFDVREVAHQLDENRDGLALLAGLVAALHLTAAGVSASLARGVRTPAA